MITGLSIQNFKSLAEVPLGENAAVSFGPLNVLIGPNGCGKSSLLQAIDFLRAFFHSSVEVYLKDKGWDYRDLPNLRRSSKTIQWVVTAELTCQGVQRRYMYFVSLQPRRHLGIGIEDLVRLPTPSDVQAKVLLARKGRKCLLHNEVSGDFDRLAAIGLPASVMSRLDSAADEEKYPELLMFREWVEGFRSYLIWDPKVLRNPDRGPHDEIGPSGEHLASVIGRLKDRNRPAFKKLVRRVKRLFPTLTDISISGQGWGWRTIKLHESKGNGGNVIFNSQQMSDGVLRLLAVASMLYVDRVPSVLTFEEPENGVHPQLLREVVQILREITQRKAPNPCQVFVTTHSPYVLDEFYDHPEQVYCMERPRPGAGARILRLSENSQLKIARESFKHSLGEAWFMGLLGATAGQGGS